MAETGYTLELVTLLLAVGSVLLSAYNWFQARKSADIVPNRIINYGMIYSLKDNDGVKLILPLIFHNDRANNGLITRIKVGFKVDGKVKYLSFVGRARLMELDENSSGPTTWETFEENGYKIQQPTYPIVVPGEESIFVVMIANEWEDEMILPVDKETKCVIEVYFGEDEKNDVEFPFYLQEKHIPNTALNWYTPISEPLSDDVPDDRE